MTYVLIGLLKVYRLVISPLYGNVCRYYPSCSAYALGAVEQHGATKGVWYAGRRLLRCHPWASGGYDPVPGTAAAKEWAAECATHSPAKTEAAGLLSTGAKRPGQQKRLTRKPLLGARVRGVN